MQDVTVTDKNDATLLVSPYNRDMIMEAKQIGGRWDPASHAWRFDIRDHDRVVRLANKYYGYVDADTGGAVTIRIKAGDYDFGLDLMVAGRVIAHRPGRDAPVRLAANTILVSGRFSASGGSRKTPYVSWPDDEEPVLEIRDLPAGVTDLLDREGRPYELVEQDDPKQTLREERERLMKRIEEIDRLLAA